MSMLHIIMAEDPIPQVGLFTSEKKVH